MNSQVPVYVIDRVEQAAGIGFQLFEHAVGKERRRSFLNKLLVAALHGAVAGGIHGEIAVRIASALRFDVTALVDEPFDEILVQIAALQRIVVHVEATSSSSLCRVMPRPPPPSVRLSISG